MQNNFIYDILNNIYGKGNLIMKDKYTMTQEENVLIGKRLLVDVVYKSANLEEIVVTFADKINIKMK